MKKTIIVSIVISIFLIGCGSQQKIDEIFNKKMQCQKLQNEIEQKIKEKTWSYPQENESGNGAFWEIFYSPVKNSCLYIWEENFYVYGRPMSHTYHLSDALTGKDIESKTWLVDDSNIYSLIDFIDNEASKYKTEFNEKINQ